jgi:hypothetical protein
MKYSCIALAKLHSHGQLLVLKVCWSLCARVSDVERVAAALGDLHNSPKMADCGGARESAC